MKMKKIIFAFSVLFFFSSCKKDVKVCNIYTELLDHDNLVDITILKSTPEIYDTIVKYKLQVREIVNDNILFGFKSNLIYKDLMVFNEDYYLYKNKFANSFVIIGQPTIDSIKFSLKPNLACKDAIHIAEKNISFNNTCIFYRLGILNINAGVLNSQINCKLVWKIQGENGWPYVILDANTGQVYLKDDGIRL
jgi:hypothetical protein